MITGEMGKLDSWLFSVHVKMFCPHSLILRKRKKPVTSAVIFPLSPGKMYRN